MQGVTGLALLSMYSTSISYHLEAILVINYDLTDSLFRVFCNSFFFSFCFVDNVILAFGQVLSRRDDF